MAQDKKGLLNFLKFDPKLKNSIVAKYLSNPRLVVLLLILIIAVGINAFITLPRALNPEVKIPIIVVNTVLPGAAPSDVESLVTIPIEDSLNSLNDVKNVTSTSQTNVSTITLEFESSVNPDKAKSDVQNAVDSVGNLPADANDPQVIKIDFENSPVWTFVLRGNTDDGSLFKFADSLSQKLEDLPQIDKVTLSGVEKTEVQITIDPATYAAYGANPQIISGAVSSALRSFPAGNVKTESSNFALTIDPSVTTIDDIRNIKITLAGQVVSLSDIAVIAEKPKPGSLESYVAYPNSKEQRAVTFSVFRVKTYDIDESVKAAEDLVNREIKVRNGKFQAETLINTANEVTKQFNDLTRDFLITVFLVVAVLFVFLGFRESLVSSLSAPLSFLITFIVMQYSGITLNFLSLFSLILSLGLLVDDTVVIISAVSSYYRTGRFTPYEVGLMVWRDFLAPVFTTTITTVWAFLPLLLATGIIGEFIKSIPIVVSTALIASFFVGMFITLPVMIIFLNPKFPRRVMVLLKIIGYLAFVGLIFAILPHGKLFVAELIAFAALAFVVVVGRNNLIFEFKERFKFLSKNSISKSVRNIDYDRGIISFEGISQRYKSIIERILAKKSSRRMVVSMVIILSIFSFLLVPLGFVKNEFFPKTDANILYVSVEYPAGTNADVTRSEALDVLNELKKTEGVNYVSFDLGSAINTESGGVSSAGSNNVLFSLNLKDEGARPESFDIAEGLRAEFAGYTKGKLSVVEQSGGPPAGADVQIKILGDDLSVLDQKANEVVRYLEKEKGVANIEKSIKPGTGKLVFVPDNAKLASNGVDVNSLGYWLRLYASGIKFDSNKFPGDSDDRDITLRLYGEDAYANSLTEIMIPTQNGSIPLSALGNVKLASNPTLITREDGKRSISVTAALRRGYNLNDINSRLEKFADNGLNLDSGYTWKTGGVNEQNQESVNSILTAMLLSFMLIIITMVIQFSSFRRAIIVMLVIPLSISGVFILFALTGTPLSFPALIGVLALFGIVVKNSILVVDKILENQKHSEMSFIESISNASASRLEPIALTSVSTIIGLIPITLTDPLWRGLGGAIIAGLTFSGIIMLFFIPVIYYIFMDGGKQK